MGDRGDVPHNSFLIGRPINFHSRGNDGAGDRSNRFPTWLNLLAAIVLRNRRRRRNNANNNENNENPANNENNENHENHENHDNNEDHYNADNLDNDNVNDNIDIDNIDNHNIDSAEVAVGVSPDVEEHDLLPRRSMKRSREEEEQDDEERDGKRFCWWNENDCSSDSDTYSVCCDNNNTDKNTGNTAVEHAGPSAEVAEEDPLPGPSRKRSREHGSKKFRQCHEFADSDSDTDTDTTGHNLPPAGGGGRPTAR